MNIFITPKISLDKNKSLIFSLEKNWIDYAKQIKINLFIVFDPSQLKKLFLLYKPEGLIVSGGGNIYIKEKNKSNFIRDKNERQIIDFFSNKKLPILAICRGFQLFCSLNNIKLSIKSFSKCVPIIFTSWLLSKQGKAKAEPIAPAPIIIIFDISNL